MSTLKNNEKSRMYHHGDLRNTLIQLGTEMLIESGEAALSLRKLAQRAGVSHNAPYQHFPDKEALIAAIAEDGFRLLGEALAAAVADSAATDPQGRLIALGRGYVRFALAHPSHMQVMFGPLPASRYPSLAERSLATLDILTRAVREAQAVGHLRPDDSGDAALGVWMLLHGLSAVLIAGKIPDTLRRDRDADALTERFVTLLCAGLLR